MREVAVIGVGMTPFGKQPERGAIDLGYEATLAAMRDCDISPAEIDCVYCANVYHVMVLGQSIVSRVGITGREVVNVENICAGGATAFREVWYNIASGRYDIGMALGVESMSNSGMMGQLLPPSEDDLEGQMGMSMPLAFALILRRHMEQYGTTLEQVAKIAVKNHHNSIFNPYCCFKKEFTVEEVVNSPMICDPITRYQCCANTDGAAALILCAADKAAKYTSKPVYVAGSALNMGGYRYFQEDLCFSDVSYKTAQQAYEMAGIGPEDLDLVECHDPMAANEIFHYEELALCEKGDGGKMIEEGLTELGGKIPVNPSGGLMGLGHPASASGARQLVELTYHLREEAGERQVKGAKVGLAHIIGGSVINLEAGVSAVHILKV